MGIENIHIAYGIAAITVASILCVFTNFFQLCWGAFVCIIKMHCYIPSVIKTGWGKYTIMSLATVLMISGSYIVYYHLTGRDAMVDFVQNATMVGAKFVLAVMLPYTFAGAMFTIMICSVYAEAITLLQRDKHV